MSIDKGIEWKPVVGLEGKYEVNGMGDIKSLHYRGVKGDERILKPYIEKGNHNYAKYTLVAESSRIITIQGHRVVMAAFEGAANGRFIDHINGDGSDNRLCNLRYCTHRENLTFDNVKFKKERSSKHPGVSYNANSNGKKKWRSIIQVDRKKIALGTFATELEAAEAYQNKLKEIQ